MSQPNHTERARQIADAAAVTFGEHQRLISPDETRDFSRHLNQLRTAQQPEQLRAAVIAVRADLGILFRKPGCQQARVMQVYSLMNPSERQPVQYIGTPVLPDLLLSIPTNHHSGETIRLGHSTMAEEDVEMPPEEVFKKALMKEHNLRFISCLGQGGNGAVYLVENMELERNEALKVSLVQSAKPSREAALAGKFTQEQGLVPVHKVGKVNGMSFTSMLYLEHVRDMHGLPDDLETLTLLVACGGMANSVESMHDQGLLHRDLKPANFLIIGLENGDIVSLRKKMRVYGSDFGLARKFGEQDPDNEIIGTPVFMSPEQGRAQQLTPASDIYSLGLSMFHVLMNKLPYPEDVLKKGAAQIVSFVRNQEVSPIKEKAQELIAKGVPENIVNLLIRMTEPDPKKRPEISEVTKAFNDYLERLDPTVKAKKFLLTRVLPAVVLVGALAVPVAISRTKHADYTKAHAQNLSSADDLLSKSEWGKAVMLLEEAMKRERESGQAGSAELNELTERRDRAKAQLDAIENQRVCLEAYAKGLRAYRMGQVAEAKADFVIVAGKGMAGLDEAQRRDLGRCGELLKGWEAKKPELERAARQLEEAHINALNNQLVALVQAATKGDPDAAMMVIMARDDYKTRFMPQVLKDSEGREGRSPSATSRRYGDRPDVQLYGRTCQLYTTATFQLMLSTGNSVQHPGTGAGLQRIIWEAAGDCQLNLTNSLTDISAIGSLMEQEEENSPKWLALAGQLTEKKATYCMWLLALADTLSRWSDHAQQRNQGLLISVPGDTIEACFRSMLGDAITGAQAKFTKTEQAELLQHMESTTKNPIALEMARRMLTR